MIMKQSETVFMNTIDDRHMKEMDDGTKDTWEIETKVIKLENTVDDLQQQQ